MMLPTLRSFAILPAAALLLSGCATMREGTGTMARSEAIAANDWRSVATDVDRRRIGDWWGAWNAGLSSARAGGHSATIAAEGALLEPQAALPNPHLPPGDYRCRIIKMGSRSGVSGPGTLSYVAYPAFLCRVAAEQTIFSFTKLTGSQRQVGLIFDDTQMRSIFLGTVALGDEARAFDYGTDPTRDVAGLIERIGPNRWRLVMPRPAFESDIDVMELVPA